MRAPCVCLDFLFVYTGATSAGLSQPQRFIRIPQRLSMTTKAATSTIRAPADGDFYKYGLKPVVGKSVMDATLKRLGPVEIKAMEKSNFVKPQSVMYELDGKFPAWSDSMCMSIVL